MCGNAVKNIIFQMVLCLGIFAQASANTSENPEKIIQSEKKDIKQENTDKNPTPYGIKIGETTEKEICSKFSVTERFSWTDTEGYTLIFLDKKGFYLPNLSVAEVSLVINPQGIVAGVQTAISGKRFSELHPILANKYNVIRVENPFVGNKRGEYEIGNLNIVLEEEHMNFYTVLCYITKEADKILYEYKERRNKQKKQNMADSL